MAQKALRGRFKAKKVFFIGHMHKFCCSILSSYRTAKCSTTNKCSISGSYKTPQALISVPGRLIACKRLPVQDSSPHRWQDAQSPQTRLNNHSILFINILVSFDDGSIDEHCGYVSVK